MSKKQKNGATADGREDKRPYDIYVRVIIL